jgi:hypothetical protein
MFRIRHPTSRHQLAHSTFFGDLPVHTCPPPTEELAQRIDADFLIIGSFGHLLLVQREADDGSLVACLRPYFESAHLDARQSFHADIGIDLHPDAEEDAEPVVTYPGCLPSTTKLGLFGEVLAGLVTQNYPLVGGHAWSIPIFLFRFHDDARNYLFDLARNPERTRQAIGRLGSDFIGLLLAADGAVARFIVGEAKWRATLTAAVVDTLRLGRWAPEVPGQARVRSGNGVWNNLNTDSPVPTGMRQLQRLLQENDPDGFDAAILSMEQALLVRGGIPLPRTDLVVIAGNGQDGRTVNQRLLPHAGMPPEYTAGNDLQLVEVVFMEGQTLISSLYDSLWSGEENA